LHAGQTSCAELVKEALQRAEEKADLNIFIELFPETARAQARAVDAKLAAGTAGPLAGVTIALKDNLCFKGHGVSAGSNMLRGFESQFTATVVQRLIDADAIILRRTGCDEFAMGSSNETSAYGPVKIPVDPSLTPGGSSGVSAAAVAAGICHAALGSDTGGSIRQPAAFTGTYGVKPTYGRVSRHGVIAYASSFDQVGPFARSLDDLARITEVISGADAFDTTCSERPVPAMGPIPAERPFTFGYYQEVLDNPALDAEIRQYFFDRVDQLKAAGHRVEALDFPYLDALVPIYYILTTAEASSNLARYDGVHIGHRSEKATDLESLYKKSRSEGFGEEVQRRILLGTFVLSAGYFDAFYGKAQKARRVVRDATLEALTQVDALIGPTTPHTAFPLGQEYTDPTVLYLEDIFTVQAPIAGIPAMNIPAGPHSNGLPFGMQIMAGPFDEPKLFQAAHILDCL